MQLQEFTCISPSIETGQVFKAIESAIPTTAIDRVIAKSTSRGQLNAKTTCPVGCMFGHRYEFVVQGSDAGCFEESSRWIECAMDARSQQAESTQQCLHH